MCEFVLFIFFKLTQTFCKCHLGFSLIIFVSTFFSIFFSLRTVPSEGQATTPMFALLKDGSCPFLALAEVLKQQVLIANEYARITYHVVRLRAHDFYDKRVAPLIRDLQLASHSREPRQRVFYYQDTFCFLQTSGVLV